MLVEIDSIELARLRKAVRQSEGTLERVRRCAEDALGATSNAERMRLAVEWILGEVAPAEAKGGTDATLRTD